MDLTNKTKKLDQKKIHEQKTPQIKTMDSNQPIKGTLAKFLGLVPPKPSPCSPASKESDSTFQVSLSVNKKQKNEQMMKSLESQQNLQQKNDTISITTSEKVQTGGKNLFQGLSFCFPISNINLTLKRIENITKTIKQNGGMVYTFQQLIQKCENPEQNSFPKQLYFLADPQTSREALISLIPLVPQDSNNLQELKDVENPLTLQKNSLTKDPLDEVCEPLSSCVTAVVPLFNPKQLLQYGYIFACVKNYNILDIQNFVIQQTMEQLQLYLKSKRKQIQIENYKEENSKNLPKVYVYEPAEGIELREQTKDPESKEMLETKSKSFNKSISQVFEKLRAVHELKDPSRAALYNRIKVVISRPSTPRIYCVEDVDTKLSGIRFFGQKTRDKIKQFIRTGSIQKYTLMANEDIYQACVELEGVYGIGKKKAQKFFEMGIKSVESLRKAVETGTVTLTKNQIIGLKYYESLTKRIPYDEVTQIFQFVKRKFWDIVGSQTEHHIQVCGSYRRKKPTCGDIDIIISRKDSHFQKDLISKLVNELTQCGFITDLLTSLKTVESTDSSVSFMGICKHTSQIHRRIDIKYYSVEQYPFALLYFTGSQDFNINLRNHALRMGYTLSDHGMWQAERVGKQVLTKGPPLSFISEQEIFKFFNLIYQEPENRSI